MQVYLTLHRRKSKKIFHYFTYENLNLTAGKKDNKQQLIIIYLRLDNIRQQLHARKYCITLCVITYFTVHLFIYSGYIYT